MKPTYLHLALQGLLSLIFLAVAYGCFTGVMNDALLLLGFPEYLSTILGIAYSAAVVCIWQTKFLFLQEWAWSGLFISLAGASAAHMYTGLATATPAIVLQVLVILTYLLRTYVARQEQAASSA